MLKQNYLGSVYNKHHIGEVLNLHYHEQDNVLLSDHLKQMTCSKGCIWKASEDWWYHGSIVASVSCHAHLHVQ